MTERLVTHATFVVERRYDAAPARVFRAFADPTIKCRWFAEGEGWEVEVYENDFRVGGMERSRFRFDGYDGAEQRKAGTRELLEALAGELKAPRVTYPHCIQMRTHASSRRAGAVDPRRHCKRAAPRSRPRCSGRRTARSARRVQ